MPDCSYLSVAMSLGLPHIAIRPAVPCKWHCYEGDLEALFLYLTYEVVLCLTHGGGPSRERRVRSLKTDRRIQAVLV